MSAGQPVAPSVQQQRRELKHVEETHDYLSQFGVSNYQPTMVPATSPVMNYSAAALTSTRK